MLWVRHRFTGFLRAVPARLRAWAAGDFAAFLMAMPWVVVLRRGVFWLKRPWRSGCCGCATCLPFIARASSWRRLIQGCAQTSVWMTVM